MKSLIAPLLVASLSLSLASLTAGAGCAAPTEQEVSEGASAATDDPRGSLAKDSKSLTLSENGEVSTIGAPKKIKAALESLTGTLTPLGGAPRCGPPRLTLTFAGAAAKKLATVNVCGETQAFLQTDGKWFQAKLAEPALRKAFAGKPLVGDLLLDATEVAVGNAEGIGERQPSTAFVKGLDLDAEPATRSAAQTPRCAPLMNLHFTKGISAVAELAVFCPKGENDTIAPATLTVKGKLVGWVTYDISAVLGGGF
jgi:hypothetical protein